ncbi:MAG: hypothetical protein AAGF47_02860 [Planctomycetota bacterium]
MPTTNRHLHLSHMLAVYGFVGLSMLVGLVLSRIAGLINIGPVLYVGIVAAAVVITAAAAVWVIIRRRRQKRRWFSDQFFDPPDHPARVRVLCSN